MKKLIVGLLVACTLFTTSAYASSISIDVSSMTMEELVSFRDEINQEINSRLGSDESKIYIGDYVVGKDIKPGRYIIIFEENPASTKDEEGGKVLLYKDQDAADDWDPFFANYYYFGQECYVELTDGMVMSIVYSSGLIRLAAKPSWAP